MNTVVLALGCHPDDIEMLMSGTMFLLKDAGCELHYMNVANGSCGTSELSEQEIIAIRADEARNAADYLGAVYHESLVNDLEVFYTDGLLRRVASVVREVNPEIILTQSPQDYMEDHMNTSRLAVTAAFTRGMLNYTTVPEHPPVSGETALYHAMPYGLVDQLRNPVIPDMYIDISSKIDEKRAMLACHKSQKVWLDESQGLDSYIDTMAGMVRDIGSMSGRYTYAEGWRRHFHVGFTMTDRDPLADLLSGSVLQRDSTTG